MSGEVYYVICPQCGELAVWFFDYFPIEHATYCPVCGYSKEQAPIFDRKRQAEDPEHRLFLKRTKDGKLIYRTYERKGYGALAIHYYNKKVTPINKFHKPITEKLLNWAQEVFASPDVDAENSYLTRWNEESQQVEVVIGNLIIPGKIEEGWEFFDERSECEDE